MRYAINLQAVVLDVLDDTDDGEPRHIRELRETEVPAERIAVSPVAASGGFIDDGDRLFTVLVAFGKQTSANQRRPHHFEIAGAGANHFRAQVLRGFHGTVFDRQNSIIGLTGSGKSGGHAGQLNARDGAHAAEGLADKYSLWRNPLI